MNLPCKGGKSQTLEENWYLKSIFATKYYHFQFFFIATIANDIFKLAKDKFSFSEGLINLIWYNNLGYHRCDYMNFIISFPHKILNC